MYSERHELGSRQKLTGITWHTFSLFLTEDFPIEGHRYEHISLGQFHGYLIAIQVLNGMWIVEHMK